MLKAVDAIHLLDHLDLFQFLDRSRNGHVVWSCHIPFQLILEAAVQPVSDNEGNEFDEDLTGSRLVRMNSETPVAKIGFVSPEQLFLLIPALVEIHCFGCTHLRLFSPEEKQLLLLVIDEVEAVTLGARECHLFPLIGRKQLCHPINARLKSLLLSTVFRTAVGEMKVPLLLV